MACNHCSCANCLRVRKEARESRRANRLFWIDSYKNSGILQNSYRMARAAHFIGRSDMPVRRCTVQTDVVGTTVRCTMVREHTGWHSSDGYLNWRE